MSTHHTPGPWGIKVEPDMFIITAPRLEYASEICACPNSNAIDMRNAHLIAAAPDLLLAMQECLPDLEHYVRTHGPGPDVRLAKARAAITKATNPSA